MGYVSAKIMNLTDHFRQKSCFDFLEGDIIYPPSRTNRERTLVPTHVSSGEGKGDYFDVSMAALHMLSCIGHKCCRL